MDIVVQENLQLNAGNEVPREIRVDSSDTWPVSTVIVNDRRVW